MNNTPKKIQSFTDLEGWQQGHRLVLAIYKVTQTFPKYEQLGLTSQIRRATISITSNISEGFGRRTFKDKIRFYEIALSSLNETQNQLIITRDVHYLTTNEFSQLALLSVSVAKLLNGLISSTKNQLPASSFQLRNSNPQNGSVFLEILLTIGIVSIASVGLVLAIIFAIKVGIRAKWDTLAGEIGRQELEIIRHTPFEQLALQADGALIGNPEPNLSVLPNGAGRLTIQSYQSSSSIHEIILTITYTESGRTQTKIFTTLVTDGGLNG